MDYQRARYEECHVYEIERLREKEREGGWKSDSDIQREGSSSVCGSLTQ